ncbi:chemotaxis protein CheW [Candidatus Hodarchaeum mangrovi]
MDKSSLPVDVEGYLIVEVQNYRFAIPISSLNGIEPYKMMELRSFYEYNYTKSFKRVINLESLLKLEKREVVITDQTRILNYVREKGNEIIRVRIDQISGYIKINKRDIQKINEPQMPFITHSIDFYQQTIPILNLFNIINNEILLTEHSFK